jgi:hypothetical protein
MATSMASILFTLLGCIFIAYVIVSIVLFIVDGVNAKREGRKRTVGLTVMFIVAMALLGLTIVFCALLFALTMAIVSSM